MSAVRAIRPAVRLSDAVLERPSQLDEGEGDHFDVSARGVDAVAGGQGAICDCGRRSDQAVVLADMVSGRVDVEWVDLEPADEAVEHLEVFYGRLVALGELLNPLVPVRLPRLGIQFACFERCSAMNSSSAPGGSGTNGRSSRTAVMEARSRISRGLSMSK